jgi:hypothetical protein
MATNIRLTPTHIIATIPARVAGAPPKVETQKLQRSGPMIFPLASVVLMPNAGHEAEPMVEVAHAGNMQMSWICAERWDDLLQAMREPCPGALIEPLLRHPSIKEAAKAASPYPPAPEPQQPPSERKAFPMPATVSEMMRGGEVIDEEYGMTPSEMKQGRDEMIAYAEKMAAEGAGVTLPPPASSRELQAGDLRIVPLRATGRYWIEIAEAVDGGIKWTRMTVPSALLGTFAEWASADRAIRIAGLAHRLIDQGEQSE